VILRSIRIGQLRRTDRDENEDWKKVPNIAGDRRERRPKWQRKLKENGEGEILGGGFILSGRSKKVNLGRGGLKASKK